MSPLVPRAYSNPRMEQDEKLHAKNIKPTACFLSLLVKYFLNTDTTQQCDHSLKYLYFSSSILKNSNSAHFAFQKKRKVLLPPFSTKLFLHISKHRLHICQTGDLESYLWCVDMEKTLLRRTHRVYEILPGSKEVCCMVHRFL